MSRVVIILSALVAAALAGCEASRDVGPLEREALIGVWSGRALPPLGGATSQLGEADSLRVDVNEDADGRVSGSAIVARNGQFRVYAVAGENRFPRVVLILDPGLASGAVLLQVEGEFVSATSVRVQIAGDGFAGDRVLLQRRSVIF